MIRDGDIVLTRVSAAPVLAGAAAGGGAAAAAVGAGHGQPAHLGADQPGDPARQGGTAVRPERGPFEPASPLTRPSSLQIKFQEKLQELAPVPELLKATQLRLADAQQQQAGAEHRAEQLARELNCAREKVRGARAGAVGIHTGDAVQL